MEVRMSLGKKVRSSVEMCRSESGTPNWLHGSRTRCGSTQIISHCSALGGGGSLGGARVVRRTAKDYPRRWHWADATKRLAASRPMPNASARYAAFILNWSNTGEQWRSARREAAQERRLVSEVTDEDDEV